MQKYSYYPGCTLKSKATELDNGGRKSAEILGFELEEIPDFQCCGGVYPLSKDETAQKLGAVRALKYASEHNQKLVTLCSACYNVLKLVNNDFKDPSSTQIKNKINTYLKLNKTDYDNGLPYNGDAKVVHYLEVLRDDIGFEKISEKVKTKINKKIAAYYGCLLLRPSKILKFDDPENPSILEDFIKSVGGDAVKYSLRNECCGSYGSLENNVSETTEDGICCGTKSSYVKSQTIKALPQSVKIIRDAVSNGAEMIITACPLCMYNLQKAADYVKDADGKNIEIKYFTEILFEALK